MTRNVTVFPMHNYLSDTSNMSNAQACLLGCRSRHNTISWWRLNTWSEKACQDPCIMRSQRDQPDAITLDNFVTFINTPIQYHCARFTAINAALVAAMWRSCLLCCWVNMWAMAASTGVTHTLVFTRCVFTLKHRNADATMYTRMNNNFVQSFNIVY